MRIPPTASRLLAVVFALGAVACAWFFLAPPTLGGSTSYVVTDGVSMEPRFRAGDLAVVRRQRSYHVGEIVAYHSRTLDTIVLHRIVGVDGDRYTLKGDNNNFVDFERPTSSQFLGTLQLHIPGTGAHLASLRSPKVVGILAALGTLLLGGGTARRRRRRRRNATEADAPRVPPKRPRRSTSPAGGLLIVGSVLLLPFVALAITAYSRPATGPMPFSVPFQQSGSFSYSASTGVSPAYPSGVIDTGDPLFLRLIDSFKIRFAYRFSASATHRVAGSLSLSARIASSSGWARTFGFGHATAFTGDSGVASGRLNLRSLPRLLRDVESATGVNGTYTLTIFSHARTQGSLGGVPMHTGFSAPLSFSLDPVELKPVLGGSGSDLSGNPTNPLEPSRPSSLSGRHDEPLVLSFRVAQFPVASVRVFALTEIVAIVCGLLVALAFALVRTRGADESASIRARYRRWLVPVASTQQPSERHAIDVTDIDALAQIAEHYDRMILSETADGVDTFTVVDDGILYRYVVRNAEQPDTGPTTPPVHSKDDVDRTEVEAEGERRESSLPARIGVSSIRPPAPSPPRALHIATEDDVHPQSAVEKAPTPREEIAAAHPELTGSDEELRQLVGGLIA